MVSCAVMSGSPSWFAPGRRRGGAHYIIIEQLLNLSTAPPMNSRADSWYAATAHAAPPRPALCGSRQADVCVIGGGYTGLSAALHLAGRGYRVVLLEAEQVGWGASGRNGGEVLTGQRRTQYELAAWFGAETARRLWDFGLEAVALVRELVASHGIDCDLKPGLLHLAAKPRHVDELRRSVDLLRGDYGYQAIRLLDRAECAAQVGSGRYHGGTLDLGAFHVHPLNLALGVARAAEAAGVRIHEQSRAIGYSGSDPAVVRTAQGEVRAAFVVLACDGYLGRLEPRIASHILPINNFMLATEPLAESAARALLPGDHAVSDSKFVVYYWRLSSDRRLLFGGGENYSPRFPADIRAFVRRHMLKVYPQFAGLRIDYGWGGTLAVTLRRLPHFGRLEPNVFFAQGYSGQGVALAHLAGKLIAEAVAGTAERFDVMAGLPTPRFPGGTLLRHPAAVLGMLYYALLDRL
jgi:gamma-glutamylputrescine oxidase